MSGQPRFVFLLQRAQKAVQHWVEHRPGAWEGISLAQAGLLFYVRARPGASIGDIAAALQVAPAAVTNLTKRMQAAALLERVGDAADARRTRLTLSADGERAGVQADSALRELNGHLKDGFSEAELAVVARWLAQAAKLDAVSPPPR